MKRDGTGKGWNDIYPRAREFLAHGLAMRLLQSQPDRHIYTAPSLRIKCNNALLTHTRDQWSSLYTWYHFHSKSCYQAEDDQDWCIMHPSYSCTNKRYPPTYRRGRRSILFSQDLHREDSMRDSMSWQWLTLLLKIPKSSRCASKTSRCSA